MILQALNEYYERKAQDPESGIAPEGFETKEIPFIVVIDREGEFVAIEDTREGPEKKKRAKGFLVPQGAKKAAGIKANLLWDSPEYALGFSARGRDDVGARARAFLDRICSELPDREKNWRTNALLRFLERAPHEAISSSESDAPLWHEMNESNANVTFRIDGDDYPTLCAAFFQHLTDRGGSIGAEGLCLVSGKHANVARLHVAIKGVRNAQSSGASLVSFNLAAFCSYGKTQNFNSPISESAAFGYTTALNTLLSRDSRNKIQVGDATTVFWSAKPTSFEGEFAAFFSLPPKDDPDRDVNAVRALYGAAQSGATPQEADTRFYVLGLAPNAARVAVRFWQQGTVAELSHRIKQHFDDLEVVRAPKDEGRFALFWLLCELGSEGKVDNVPPNLAGNLVRAVLSGGPYPAMLLQQVVRRVRAEQEVTRLKAAMLKATLNRFQRVYPSSEKEITVALDETNDNTGYRLGRLFAVLEKIQEDAQKGINATIRDRYYGAASASPVTVFPQLLKLKNHHLAKLDNPAFKTAHEKRLAEIIGGLPPDMPAHLRMEDQARFAIGYYHQRQALFTKSPSSGS
jgi:CRISPR-associated protein Csd1